MSDSRNLPIFGTQASSPRKSSTLRKSRFWTTASSDCPRRLLSVDGPGAVAHVRRKDRPPIRADLGARPYCGTLQRLELTRPTRSRKHGNGSPRGA